MCWFRVSVRGCCSGYVYGYLLAVLAHRLILFFGFDFWLFFGFGCESISVEICWRCLWLRCWMWLLVIYCVFGVLLLLKVIKGWFEV